ncbi:MAG: EutN/CcmL family microcompartment protein [Thermoplasmata archaeon]
MQLAKIVGTVVCTRKDERMNGMKFLVVQPVGLLDLKPEGKPLVAVDAVGAGESELVLIVSGSSARLTAVTKDRPSDATIMGIVDYIDIEGKRVFSKGKTEI